MADDEVSLTDLRVIQEFSLAVRGARADRAAVVAALEADLAWLNGKSAPAKAAARSTSKAPAKRVRRT